MNAKNESNPYVGPRSFREEHARIFFGRERELGELFRMVIAERVVLLYSPSGAGKTSLLQAGLVPALTQEGFHVHPIIRVSSDLSKAEREAHRNRFIESTLISLGGEREQDEASTTKTTGTAGMSLAGYLDALRDRERGTTGNEPKFEVLIFDQFEEILTTEPASRAARKERVAFFEAVGQALHDRNRWAVFSIREDYLAGLDPYRRSIPTRLSNHFRLDLLQLAGARRAISEPPRVTANVTFDDDAVTHIVDNLSRTTLLASAADKATPDDTTTDGIYVEPLHLQVVCDRLWDTLQPQPGSRITIDQIGDLADVDTALRKYYDDEISRIAKASPQADERDIRDWFDEKLIISKLGIRGQVPHDEEMSGGLDNDTVQMLVQAKLVNKETRLKNAWYELSHDRLVAPVRQSNAEWYADKKNLEDFQRAAMIWARGNEQPSDLLTAREWWRARWRVRKGAIRLRPYERKFLDQSRSALWQRYSVPFILALVVIALLGAWRLASWESEQEALAEDANNWARSAQSLLPDNDEDDLDLGILLSAEAVGHLADKEIDIGYMETTSLFEGLAAQPYLVGPVRDADAEPTAAPPLNPGAPTEHILAISADGRHIATWSPQSPDTVSLEGVPVIEFGGSKEREREVDSISLRTGSVTSMTFVPLGGDGFLVAVGTEEGSVQLWGPGLSGMTLHDTLDPGAAEGQCDSNVVAEAQGTPIGSTSREATPVAGKACAGVTSLAMTSSGFLVAGYTDGDVVVWPLASPANAQTGSSRIQCPLAAPETGSPCGPVTGLAAGAHGELVIGYSNGQIAHVERPGSDTSAMQIQGLPDGVDAGTVALGEYVDDNVVEQRLTVVGSDGQLLMGAIEDDGTYSPRMEQPLSPGMTEIESASGNPSTLYSGHRNGQIRRWTMNEKGAIWETFSPTTGFDIENLNISSDGRWLVSRSDDGLVQVWSTSGISLVGQPTSGPMPPHTGCVVDVSFAGFVLQSRATEGATAEANIRDLPSTPFLPTAVPTETPMTATPSSSELMTETPASSIPRAIPGSGGATSPIADESSDAENDSVSCASRQRLEGEDLAGLTATPDVTVSARAYGLSSLDGEVRATVHVNGEIMLFERDGDGWTFLDVLAGAGTGEVTSIALSHEGAKDGGIVAVGYRNGAIDLWMNEGGSWRLLGRLTGHPQPVTALRFHPEKRYLASGDFSGMVIVWNIEPGEWVDFACQRADRGLSDDEIERHLERDPEDWDRTCDG